MTSFINIINVLLLKVCCKEQHSVTSDICYCGLKDLVQMFTEMHPVYGDKYIEMCFSTTRLYASVAYAVVVCLFCPSHPLLYQNG